MPLTRRSSTNALDIWPGFVDSLATLLMVIIFLLMIFVMAQFFLNDALLGRDRAMERMNHQIEELADLLGLERLSNEDLRQNLKQLSNELQNTLATRDALATDLTKLRNKNADLDLELAQAKTRFANSDDENTRLSQQLSELREDVEAMTDLRNQLARKLSATQTKLEKQSKKSEMLLSEEQKISEAAKAHAAKLSRQMKEFRKQLTKLNAALEVSEAQNRMQGTQIIDLGKRLNAALATKVQELAHYRSEFFGRLRQIMGNRTDVRVVGDRFVFQSEVLFGSGSARLGKKGKLQLAQLAKTLKQITRKIPKDLAWVLRIDGHTDRLPIQTSVFPSNWELSTERAISVVKFLISEGISAQNLAAAGFGEYQPLDSRNDEIAFRRNRRIELKLDQR